MRTDTPTEDEGDHVKRSAVDRISRLLASFEPEERSHTLTSLSAKAGLPLSTTHRMVADLLRAGMLERDDEDRLIVGVAVWRLGQLASRTHLIHRIALPFMQDLYSTTGLTTHLSVIEGDRLTFIESLRPSDEHDRPIIGKRELLHVTASGKAILAFVDQDFRSRYLGGLSDWSPTAISRLRREIDVIRSQGYAAGSRRAAPRAAVAAPILTRVSRSAFAALSLIVPEGVAVRPYGHLVLSSARAIQRAAWDQGAA